MHDGSGTRGRLLVVLLVACALWLPVQNAVLLAMALGAHGGLRELFHALRPVALPVLLGAAIASVATLTAMVALVWAMRGRGRIRAGGRA